MTSRPDPASPSELPLSDGPAKTLRDFFWLLRAELFVLREEWFWYLLQASFVSLSYLAFLWFLIGPQAPSAAENLIVGSLVMSLSFAGMLSLGQHIGYLKELQAFDYYAALPLSKGAFIAALTTPRWSYTQRQAVPLLTPYFRARLQGLAPVRRCSSSKAARISSFPDGPGFSSSEHIQETHLAEALTYRRSLG